MNANQNQSIIKLPLIFIVFFIPIEWLISSIRSYFTYSTGFEGSYFQYITYHFYDLHYFFYMFGFYLLFFVTAILCCQTYRLHLLGRDFWRVFIIAVISSGTFIYVLIFLYNLKFKCDDFIIDNSPFIFDYSRTIGLYDFFRWLIRLISSIGVITGQIFFINLVFYVFAKRNLNLRQTFHANLSEKNKINCFNYSVLMIIPSAIFVILNTFLSLEIKEKSPLLLVPIFIVLIIQYLVTYFSVYKNFSSINSLINFEKLIIIMLVCSTISCILSGVFAYCICIDEIILNNNLVAPYKIINLENWKSTIFWCFIFSYLVLSCIFSRYLVKRICVDNP